MKNDLEINKELAISQFSSFLELMKIKVPVETPKRFVSLLDEMLSYRNVSNEEIAETINKTFGIDCDACSKNMILIKDIEVFSLCEHHLALIYDMKVAVAYIPKDKVLGLSKIIRCVSMVSKRPQLQEKIAFDIIDVMKRLLSSDDIAVYIEAKHGCVTARGIKNFSAETVTTNFSGEFCRAEDMKANFLLATRRIRKVLEPV
ncbi:MAG: GTP cyclohydrolase I FolE [Oscillospiraceae bacterium]|nr:GTP cyclohydrolase I FolE [Oscillospiraceae bacterium]